MKRAPRRIALGIRAQLLLVLTVFLALPWLGYEYVRELERFLRDAQERTLAGTAQAVATALHDRPRLFEVAPAPGHALVDRARARAVPSPAPRVAPPPPAAPSRSPEIAQIIQGLSRTTARIWVVDRDLDVLARAGSLKGVRAAGERRRDAAARLAVARPRVAAPSVRAGARRSRPRISTRSRRGRILLPAREVDGALPGILTVDRRPTPDGKAVDRLGRASDLGRRPGARRGHRRGDDQRGARRAQPRVRAAVHDRARGAAHRLAGADAVRVAAVVAHSAPARRGRSRHRRAGTRARARSRASDAGDEIGDLSRSFSSVLSRLAQYASYQQNMASRLSHELRTPVAVVRSSLDNLRASSAARRRARVHRARAGWAQPADAHPDAHDRGDAAGAEPRRGRRARALRSRARSSPAASTATASRIPRARSRSHCPAARFRSTARPSSSRRCSTSSSPTRSSSPPASRRSS